MKTKEDLADRMVKGMITILVLLVISFLVIQTELNEKEKKIPNFISFYNIKEAKASLPTTTNWFCFQLKNGNVGCVIGEQIMKEDSK